MALATISESSVSAFRSYTTYDYTPLGHNQTRILTIFPAQSFDDEIHSRLRHVSLGKRSLSRFKALSYTWGSNELTNNIWINNSVLKVTTNLHQVLRHLREKEATRTIWIDAICIDQRNQKERSKQIQHMGKIYSSVYRVVIRLGKPEDDDFSLNNGDAAANFLFRQPWWHRSWVVQEFQNARDRTFLCGSAAVSWEEIVDIMHKSKAYDNPEYTHVWHFHCANNSGGKLRSIMNDLGHCGTTDPRDKVYAFLGIADDGNKFKPDYEASVRNVYTDVVKIYVKKERNLEIICGHHRSCHHQELPSWVPNWSINRNLSRAWTVDLHGHSIYSAGYCLPKPVSRPVTKYPSVHGLSFESSDVLKAPGITLGSIAEMGQSLNPTLFETTDWTGVVRSWLTGDIESGTYFNGEDNLRAFFCTLIADVWENGRFRIRFNMPRLEKEFRDLLNGYPDPPGREHALSIVVKRVRQATYGLCFARISPSYMGLIPDSSKIGDEICILRGCSTPMVMRRKPEDGTMHQMIGPCYVHGVMDGEMAAQMSELFIIQ